MMAAAHLLHHHHYATAHTSPDIANAAAISRYVLSVNTSVDSLCVESAVLGRLGLTVVSTGHWHMQRMDCITSPG